MNLQFETQLEVLRELTARGLNHAADHQLTWVLAIEPRSLLQMASLCSAIAALPVDPASLEIEPREVFATKHRWDRTKQVLKGLAAVYARDYMMHTGGEV